MKKKTIGIKNVNNVGKKIENVNVHIIDKKEIKWKIIYLIYLLKKINYVIDNNLKSLVIGISGGLDSAIVIGLSIPIDSSNIHRKQADLIGKKYCNSFQEFNGWDIKKMILI